MASFKIYTQYDVIFLKYFYYKIIHNALEDVKTDNEKKMIFDLYQHVLPELTRLSYMESNKVTNLKQEFKNDVDVVNNYFIKGKNLIKMIDIYKNSYPNIYIPDPGINLDKILNINNFKKIILLIIQRMVYGHISKNCIVFKNREERWKTKLDNDIVIGFFEELKFNYLAKLFMQIDKILELRVIDICQKNKN